MDTTSLIEIVVAIIVAYFLIKFIISPIIKIIVGIIILFVLIYLLQKFFGVNLNQILTPFGISFDINNESSWISWILNPFKYFIDQAKILLNFIS